MFHARTVPGSVPAHGVGLHHFPARISLLHTAQACHTRDRRAAALAEAIYQDKKNRYRVSLAKNHLQSLLLDIYDKYHRFYNQAESGSGDRQDELFKNFIMLLNEHSTTEREVAFYARQLGISTKYLSGICRHIANKSAKEVIDNFAILQIKVLLQSTELSIVEIADRLRFPDQSYMGRYFKRHEGITPKEYRAGKSEEW